MGKKLIIAEKPSLANKIAGAIGNMKRNNDYTENDEYIVISVFGHLLTLYDIEDYTKQEKGKWTLENLPFFPTEFQYKVKNDSGIKERYKLIKELIKRNDVEEIINAGDSDREGEVLVNIVVYKIFKELNLSKKITRIWLEDQTENTIRNELRNRKNIKNTENLYNEGLARTFIDWLYGINLTRYITVKTGKLLNTGRVIIPTVKYVYDRDMEILNFKPEKYYVLNTSIYKFNQEIKLDFSKLKFNKDELELAKEVNEKLQNAKIKVIDIENKESIRKPKKLFSLASLQNYMSKNYKISLDKTLSIVQSLYEKGFLTYPRTNTEYLSEEEKGKIENILNVLNNPDLELKNSKNIFDSSKVESHSAITITEKIANETELSEDEKKVYNTVKNRFLANFVKENCCLLQTIITFQIEGTSYQTKLRGTTIFKEGYLKYENDLNEKQLPMFEKDEIFDGKFKLEEKMTLPPHKVSEEELNKFYEKPFKNFKTCINNEDEEEQEENDSEDYKLMLKGIEIGTPATRSGTLEKVKKIGYISANKNILSITELGIKFIESLDKLNINLYKEKTVELSQNLKKIYNNEETIKNILKQEENEIRNIINQNVEISKIDSNINKESLGKCPICNKDIFENKMAYSCSGYKEGCKFSIWKNISGKNITKSQAQKILLKGKSDLIKGFKSKSGKDFNAYLKLEQDGSIKFEFN